MPVPGHRDHDVRRRGGDHSASYDCQDRSRGVEQDRGEGGYGREGGEDGGVGIGRGQGRVAVGGGRWEAGDAGAKLPGCSEAAMYKCCGARSLPLRRRRRITDRAKVFARSISTPVSPQQAASARQSLTTANETGTTSGGRVQAGCITTGNGWSGERTAWKGRKRMLLPRFRRCCSLCGWGGKESQALMFVLVRKPLSCEPSTYGGVIREKAAKAAQACSAWPASRARLCVYVARCTGSASVFGPRPTAAHVFGGGGCTARLGIGQCSCRDGPMRMCGDAASVKRASLWPW
ncbi:hypothetical protein B0H13DRAFT_1920683 [Mycena leptocephala]|nr:hypothetical protein B0H13DRAFT_1920683 [Mycena leptocephala]